MREGEHGIRRAYTPIRIQIRPGHGNCLSLRRKFDSFGWKSDLNKLLRDNLLKICRIFATMQRPPIASNIHTKFAFFSTRDTLAAFSTSFACASNLTYNGTEAKETPLPLFLRKVKEGGPVDTISGRFSDWSVCQTGCHITGSQNLYKSLAVAEMGDRLATIGMGRKWGGTAVEGGGAGSPLGHHLTQCGLGRGLPLYQVASWSIQPFGQNCRNATLLRVGIPLRAIFIRSLVVTRQNIYSTRALSYCSIPNKIN